MHNISEELFSSSLGKSIYEDIKRAIADFSMDARILRGVLVGFSGGPDSLMLLLFLLKYRAERGYFPIVAVHVNHMIRGEEADCDEHFSRELCDGLNVEFIARSADVPTLARESGRSIEEAARNARYSIFKDIIDSRTEKLTLAVAHNADDNFETVIINMMRGAGSRGMSGIPPCRDGLIRPLIYVKKADIIRALSEANIAFACDSTNETDDYTRNYIRHNILPLLSQHFAGAYSSVEKMCGNLRDDDECLSGEAMRFYGKYKNGGIPCAELRSLHISLLFRILKLYFLELSDSCLLERVHVSAIRGCLDGGGDFSLDLPGKISFVCKEGLCGFSRSDAQCEEEDFLFPISLGENIIADASSAVLLSGEVLDDYSSKVYNISTQADLSSAIIKGGLFIRNKRDGDSCFWGGMTHKLKKLFNDRKIPRSMRSRIPVLCDEKGVVWVPGFGVRDDGGGAKLYARILTDRDSEKRFYLPSDFTFTKNKKGNKGT